MSTLQRYSSMSADIKVQRSRFPLNRRVKFSLFHGYLHPVGSPIEILPGDTIGSRLSAFTRMSTPIVPFEDDVRQEYDFWFVPKRVLFNKTKQFYGESDTFGIATKVVEPYRAMAVGVSDLSTNLLKSESICGAFGIVFDDATGSPNSSAINVLPIRALFSVYNEYYRDENFQDQYKWDKDATGKVTTLATLGGSTVTGLSLLPQVNKDRDVVTSVLPWAQKGDPVSIGLTGNVPVITGDVNTDLATIGSNKIPVLNEGVKPAIFGASSNFLDTGSIGVLGVVGNSTDQGRLMMGTLSDSDTITGTMQQSAPVNLYAALGSATAVKINDLLYALAYQDFLARSAHFGTRYKEYIYSMFGTKIPDLSDDVPEYLGRMKFNINVQQVVQTTGFAASSSSELGALGAYSNSGSSGKIFLKSFTEPGYLVVLTYCKHKRTYSSGIDRVFVKRELLDYYQPPFANIPDVPYGSFNYWLDNTVTEVSGGFQEPWYDYHALQDRSYGMLNPKIDTLGEIWTLAEKWTTKPTLAGAFMKEDRACIERVLVTGSNGPDYLCDALLELDVTRVMPLYSSGRLERF